MYGKLIKGIGGLYTVYSEEEYFSPCRARGHFRHLGITPMVGDNVTFNPDGSGGYSIDEILERNNTLVRPPLANVDILFCVISARSPKPNLLNADKLISIASNNGIDTAVIVTKSDLNFGLAEKIAEIYRTGGFPTLVKKDDEELREFVLTHTLGRTGVFAGASGVGKSTVMNSVFLSLNIKTGSVSEKNERGRHTTRHVELFPLKELLKTEDIGFIADTPGFTMLDFLEFDYFNLDQLVYTFADFEPYLTKCRYTDCTHTKEEGCAILQAIEEGKISKSRHDSYIAIYDELKNKKEWNKKT